MILAIKYKLKNSVHVERGEEIDALENRLINDLIW